MQRGRATARDYERLALHAHERLAGVPLHDVWFADLPGGGPRRTLDDLAPLLRFDALARLNPLVRALFTLRGALGRAFGWDGERRRAGGDGPFETIYRSERETIGEVRNATVHAFSVFALVARPGGERLVWAIHVAPVGRITGWYMRAIDPFRRWLIYPALLRHVQREWARGDCDT